MAWRPRAKNSRRSSRHRGSVTPKTQSLYILDQFSALDVRRWGEHKDKYLKYHWDFYNELAHQRAQIKDQLQAALLGATTNNLKTNGWQRAIRWKWSNNPLSCAGSVKKGGGRFNIGQIDTNKFPAFHALYLAEDKETALLEAFGQDAELDGDKFTKMEFALAKEESILFVNIEVTLDGVFISTAQDPSVLLLT